MVATKKRSRGRPTKFSKTLVEEICARLEGSDMGLARMLDEPPTSHARRPSAPGSDAEKA